MLLVLRSNQIWVGVIKSNKAQKDSMTNLIISGWSNPMKLERHSDKFDHTRPLTKEGN